MKYEDKSKFIGEVKTAVQEWAEGKIDALFPNKPQARALLKRGLNNWLTREDERVNRMLDTALLFVADERGTIDSDVVVDILGALFKEMDVQRYQLGIVEVMAGKGEVVVSLPQNMYLDMIVGRLGTVRFTVDDLKELKELMR